MSTGIRPPCAAALQAQIQQYIDISNLLKKKRAEVKTMNTRMKEISDDILSTMVENDIPSCVSSEHTFSIKEKCKMKSATAKNLLLQIKDFFHLEDYRMKSFIDMTEEKRRSEAEHITALECKALKKSADAEGDASSDILGVSPLLSKTMDDMYS